MVLFPIAFIWLLCVMIWLIRNSLNEPDGREREPRRWLPRPPRGSRPARLAGHAARRVTTPARSSASDRSGV